jgi:hypothetical protein
MALNLMNESIIGRNLSGEIELVLCQVNSDGTIDSTSD